MLLPKRVKFRKMMRGRMKGETKGGDYVAFGDYALVALEPAWIRSNQIEAWRITLRPCFPRGGKIYIRVLPGTPISKKPLGVRTGKGKGAVDDWVAVVKPGRILFEVANVTEAQAREAFRLASHKLPVKTKMVSREVYDEIQ